MFLVKKKKSNFSKIVLILTLIIYCCFSNISKAEIGYSFSKNKFTNGKTEEQEESLRYYFDDDDKYYYNYDRKKDDKNKTENKEEKQNKDDKNEEKNNTAKEDKKIQPTGDKENDIKLSIGGYVDAQYFYVYQQKPYRQDILPNGLQQSPAEVKHVSVAEDDGHTLNILGKVSINPEFNRYRFLDKDNTNKKDRILTVGAKITQPFLNPAKISTPTIAPEEYIYIKTKYLIFHIGAVNSAGARMRVDPQKLASGNGGVFGTWWRYVSLPVFNTSGLSDNDRNALNAMSPVYILYPTLPNEAGFTSQRASIGRELTSANFDGGNINSNNLLYGNTSQGYPTQGAYSNKISLYLPRIKGFSLGVSYSPTTANTGLITRELNKGNPIYDGISGGFVKHYTSVAADYRKQWEKYGLGIAVSASYEYGKVEPIKYLYDIGNENYRMLNISTNKYYERNDLNAFAVGAQVVYKNYSIAYSYGYWGKSLLTKTMIDESGKYQVPHQVKNSYYHTAGIGANYGPVRASITYMRSSYAGYKLDAISLGTDFKMMSLKYLKVNPYAEIVGYIFHTQDIHLKAGDTATYKAIENKGIVTTLGIRILF